MPLDSKGKHHLNTQKAMAADKAPSKPSGDKPAESAPAESAPPPDAMAAAPAPAGPPPMQTAPPPMDAGDPVNYLAGLESTAGGKHMLVSVGDDGVITTTDVQDGSLPHQSMDEVMAYIGQILSPDMGAMQGAPPPAGMPADQGAMSGM